VNRRESDTAIYVGHNCQVCGKRVNLGVGAKVDPGQVGYWAVDPKTKQVLGWHMDCWLDKEKGGEYSPPQRLANDRA
jgi:hypothetical protein